MNPIIQMYPLVKRACLYNLAIHHGHVRGRASLAREAFCSPIPSAYYNNFHLFHLLRVFISLGVNMSNDPYNKAVHVQLLLYLST